MSTFLVFLLWIAIAAPALVALKAPKTAWIAKAFYSLGILALAAHYSGFFRPSVTVPPTAAKIGGSEDVPAGRCEQAISLAEEAGIIVGRPDPSQVAVLKEVWAQIPQPAREALIHCLERDGGDVPIEIIERE